MVALGGTAVGCAKTESADLLTSGIYAAISANATGDGNTTVSATLYVDDPNQLNFVELTGSDQLTASSGASQKPLIQSELGNLVSHTAIFPGDSEDTPYTVDFERTIDPGAPSTTVSLPAGFTIDPVAATISRVPPFELTYAPSGTNDTIVFSILGTCINPLSGTLSDDTGVLSLPPNTIVSPNHDNTVSPTMCPVTLTLSRQRSGSLDPHYGKGGTALGQQSRSVTWTSKP
jgi:hypothetical protein